MTLRDLLYLAAIAKEKSISKAAVKLFVAQPALSQCLQKVEKELDFQVFVRTPSGVVETDEGRCFLEFADSVFREQKSFEKRLADIRQSSGGEVLIGLTGTQAAYVLPYFLPQFKERYPSTQVTLVEESSPAIEEKLLKGEIDLGIIHPPVGVEGLECFELSNDDMVVIPRRTSRYQPHIYYLENDERPYLDLQFLRNEPLVLSTHDQRSRMVCDQVFRKAGITPIIKQTSRNLIALDALGQVDYATVILPRKQLSAELNRRSFFYINPEYSACYPFYVAVQKDTYRSLATENLLNLLRSLRGSF